MIKNMLFVVSLVALFSCASTERSREEVLAADDAIGYLGERLDHAESEEFYIKSPALLKSAQAKYKEALEVAQNSKNSKAGVKIAKQGLKIFNTSKVKAGESEKILRLAYKAREAALNAHAEDIFPERAKSIEEELIEAAELVERGDDKEARVQRDEVIKLYSMLQLDSLKKGISALAQKAFEEAKRYGADEYAPKSFKLAKDKIQLVKKILEVDRKEVEKANLHAKKAKYLSERAKQIAILAKSFERNDFSNEDIVLWYHENLDELAKQLNTEIAYNIDNDSIIEDFKQQLSNFEESYKEALVTSREREQKISDLEKTISNMLEAGEREEFLKNQLEERYALTQALFNNDEARVYREKNNVIIKAHGFYFPVGKSKVEMQNYPLVKKIIDAIYMFPEAEKIVISGHTDSSGSETLNLRLSKERSRNLRMLFEAIGKISSKKIESIGFGEKKPVESNNSKKGRALNRRIEVKLIKV